MQSIHRKATPAEQQLTCVIDQAYRSGDDALVNVLLIEKRLRAQRREAREVSRGD